MSSSTRREARACPLAKRQPARMSRMPPTTSITSLMFTCCSLLLAGALCTTLAVRADQPDRMTNPECTQDNDCVRDKICHENKCLCARARPIEDQDRCLPVAEISEQCALTNQCLGNSLCLDGICSCGDEAISLFNPSTKISYCHPKRHLNEECNYDSQCPPNSYCSSIKLGCLCQNGYGPATVSKAGIESQECLPKICSNSSSCESEYHSCEENRCKCLATHFDPTAAKCYKFGSTGGKPSDEIPHGVGNVTDNDSDSSKGSKINLILKDLIQNGDNWWLVLLILISLSIILLVLILAIVRKHYLGYCWTAHKKEYEPNNKNQPKNGYFNKNSINNKSFRKKSGELDNEDDDCCADQSSLVTQSDKTDGYLKSTKISSNHYVEVDMNNDSNDPDDAARLYHQAPGPLKSSTSTPV